jgi:hypothetical protein
MKAGQFPTLVRTEKYVGWRRSTIERWLRERETHAKEATSHLLAKLGNASWRRIENWDWWLRDWKIGRLVIVDWSIFDCSRSIRFDDRKRLAINTNLGTKAAVRQIAQSRTALEKCIVGFSLRGGFSSVKTGQALVIRDSGNAAEAGCMWRLDEELNIQSQALEQAVTLWLRDFDPTAAKHETTLHTIIGTLEKYVGDTTPKRPKEKKDPATGTRSQLPTSRILPMRAEAIKHAWENGLITNEEYEGAMPDEASKEEEKAA